MIIGLRHFITFDGRHTDFVGSCTYLLARDFVRNTFAILVEYQQRSDRITRKIIILLGRDALEIDFFNDVSIHHSSIITTNSVSILLFLVYK